MNKHLLYAIFLLFIFAPNGCGRITEHPVTFYYWKANVAIEETEKAYFTRLDADKLYIRFFDIDKENGEIAPKGIIKPFDNSVISAQYIPVIFITNRTFTGLNDESLRDIAQNINRLTKEIEEKLSINPSPEIQIDCDWTESTRERYFTFLSLLKEISGREITCTLRLHQVKFKEQTGIPPVKKAYLMCYATSDPTDLSGKNSILDMALLKDYTSNIASYPLQMDIALPLFSWGIITNHIGYIKLINGLTNKDLQTPEFKALGNNKFEVLKDTFFKGLYINKGFTIKIESITPALLKEAKEYMASKLKKDYSVVYYHLDKPFLERFTFEELK